MRVAILDLGTNTFNIFIAEINPSSSQGEKKGRNFYRKLYKSKISVKLGEGGIDNHFIKEKPFLRGLQALKKHQHTIEKYRAEKIIALATSAIRSASNGMDFIMEAKKKTGIDIEIISGEKEAELIYYGVRAAVKMNETPSLIMDIGGGSTEFILANNKEIFWKKSFLLGASRLIEKFNPSDPIQEKEIHLLETHLKETLAPLFSAVKKTCRGIPELIGSSGSFDSLAEMIVHRFYHIDLLKGKTEYAFKLSDYKKMYDIIVRSTYRERLKMKGLIKMRADMIVVSVILLNFVMEKLRIRKMRLSRYSLKEGVLMDLFQE